MSNLSRENCCSLAWNVGEWKLYENNEDAQENIEGKVPPTSKEPGKADYPLTCDNCSVRNVEDCN